MFGPVDTFDNCNNPLSFENHREYTEFMRENPQITRLILSIEDDGYPFLTKGIFGHTITELDLSCEPITNWRRIGEFLEALPHLTHLDLSSIPDIDLECIFDALCSLPLESLTLSHWHADKEKMRLLNDFLQKVPLKSLDLDYIHLEKEGWLELKRGSFRALEALTVDGTGMDEETCVYLGGLLEDSPMKILSMSGNDVGNALAHFPQLPSLKSLYLYDVMFTEEQLKRAYPLLESGPLESLTTGLESLPPSLFALLIRIPTVKFVSPGPIHGKYMNYADTVYFNKMRNALEIYGWENRTLPPELMECILECAFGLSTAFLRPILHELNRDKTTVAI